NGKEVAPGETGELVVTSFCNFRTPLIRYRTGDLATKASTETSCGCGRTLPLAKAILGRKEDSILTRDGRTLSFFAHRVLTPLQGIRAAQIIQRSPDHFSINLVPEAETVTPEVSAAIAESMNATLGYRPKIDIRQVPEIEKG